MLLSTVALDGNQEIFPLAYAIVSGETIDDWRFFFTCLENCLRESGKEDWTFMSDRQKGLKQLWQGCFQGQAGEFVQGTCLPTSV